MCYYSNMSVNIIPFYKNIGETPLEAIARYKKDHPEYDHMPMTYAGRLDPLVEGLLILLAGDECMKKDDYTSLSKEYELTILFGFATDTYDLLGKVVNVGIGSENFLDNFENVCKKFVGKIKQDYPPYSSRTVSGKPLWQWAREDRLNEIEIPSHEVMVHSISDSIFSEISGKELHDKIKKVIPLVKGDFRQEEILSIWQEKLKDKENDLFPIAKITINAGSGTYMRVIANDIGRALGSPALAYHIKRTKIGDYKL